MEQRNKEKLYAKGFVKLEDFVEENIVENKNDDNFDRVLCINQYYDASVAFHQPGGDGYRLVLNCLQKYLDFKFIRENNSFRFEEALFGQRVSVISDEKKDVYHQYRVREYEILDREHSSGTQADIYYLLNEADQMGIASRRCISYVNSNRLHLTAVLVQLIERIIENLEKDSLQRHKEYAKIIKIVYMTPEYAELDVNSLFELLNVSRKQYYRIRNAAITLLSETLFGIFAGEHGFANLCIKENEIYITD